MVAEYPHERITPILLPMANQPYQIYGRDKFYLYVSNINIFRQFFEVNDVRPEI
jgi:hypothetical protein